MSFTVKSVTENHGPPPAPPPVSTFVLVEPDGSRQLVLTVSIPGSGKTSAVPVFSPLPAPPDPAIAAVEDRILASLSQAVVQAFDVGVLVGAPPGVLQDELTWVTSGGHRP